MKLKIICCNFLPVGADSEVSFSKANAGTCPSSACLAVLWTLSKRLLYFIREMKRGIPVSSPSLPFISWSNDAWSVLGGECLSPPGTAGTPQPYNRYHYVAVSSVPQNTVTAYNDLRGVNIYFIWYKVHGRVKMPNLGVIRNSSMNDWNMEASLQVVFSLYCFFFPIVH